MQERVTQSSVTFLNSFSLGGLDGEQSAGTYAIETTEVPIERASFVAYRRVSTTITLPALGKASLSRQVVTIDPHELEKALRRDVSANGIRPDGR